MSLLEKLLAILKIAAIQLLPYSVVIGSVTLTVAMTPPPADPPPPAPE